MVGILNFPTGMTLKEAELGQHLKRHVKELDEERLGEFLRFCTGSVLNVSGLIKVDFTVQTISQEGRLDINVGCSCSCQTSTIIFLTDSEFTSILESNIWIMDIEWAGLVMSNAAAV